MNCPKCQTHNPEEARFCFNCGTALALECAHCGTSLPAGARFCFNCGQPTAAPDSTAAVDTRPTSKEPAPAGQDEEWLHRYIPQNLLNKLEAARSSGLMEGERRIVTILFCDVKGSTAAAAGLDPEEWSEIMSGAFEAMIAPVYRYEGTVARLTGDGLLAFFGAPIAHEDDPQRAIMAGLEIIEGVEEYGREVERRWGLEFDVRVGINTGLVVVGAVGSDLRMEYTALGNAINLASRMEQTAALGTVQVSSDTHKLVEPLFVFEDLGGIEAKGFDEPVQAYRVIDAKSDPGSLRGLEELQSRLVGRDEQMAALLAAAEKAASGSGQIMSVIGEAGLGKSRLISELKQELARDRTSRALWLEGKSHSYETSSPFTPFREIFRSYFELDAETSETQQVTQIGERINGLISGQGEFMVPFFAHMLDLTLEPAEAERIKFLQPPELRATLFAHVKSVLEAQLSQGPLVLYIDDLHWIDPTSLALLHDLLSLVQGNPLLIITAFRPRRDEPSWPFHETAVRKYPARYEAISLQPLDEEQARELVSSLLTVDDLPPQVRQTILDKAEGNPFFVEETIRTLLDNELVVRENGRWHATQEINNIAFPDTLVGVITARLDRLAEETRQIAQSAAVLGREFTHDVVADIAEKPSALSGALHELRQRELIVEKRRLPVHVDMFKHILTQEAAYASILLSNRRELHRRAAESLERRRPDQAADIARHWLEARSPARALPFLVGAGDSAARAYATDEAINFYKQALDLRDVAGDIDVIRHAYEGLGTALAFANRAPEAIEVFEELLAFGETKEDSLAQISALNKMASTSALRMGRFPDADGYLNQSENLLHLHDAPSAAAEAALIRCQMCTAQADFESVIMHMGQLAKIGEQSGAKEYQAMGLEHVASSLMWLTRYDEALETALTALELLRDIGDREHEALTLTVTLPMIALRNGDLEEAKAYLEEGLRVATHINALTSIVIGKWFLAEMARWQGDYETALTIGNEALALALPMEQMMPWLVVLVLGTHGSTYLHISKQYHEEVSRFHHHALRLLEAPGGSMTGAATWADLGYCALALGDTDLAGEVFQKGLDFPTMFKLVERPRLLAGSALVALETGDASQALKLAQAADQFAREREMQHMLPVTNLALGRILAALGREQEALSAFGEAETAALSMGMRPDAGKAMAATADLLDSAGDHDLAQEKRTAARHIVEDIAAGFTDMELKRAYLEATP